MIQLIRDMVLLPSILRRAAAAERHRRWANTPEGQERERQDTIAMLDQLRRGRSLLPPQQTDTDGDMT